MAIVEAPPFNFDLTRAGLINQGNTPLYAGDDWEIRLQLINEAGDAIALTNYLIILTVKNTDADVSALVTRRSDTNITGSSPARKQIEIDADQSAVSVDGLTGKGWLTIRFGSESADKTALLAALGLRVFDIRVKVNTRPVQVIARGHIEILRPVTDTI